MTFRFHESEVATIVAALQRAMASGEAVGPLDLHQMQSLIDYLAPELSYPGVKPPIN